jgi:histidinol-phosphate aminotransferase
MNVAKAPYNIPAPTAELARAALSKESLDNVKRIAQNLCDERDRLTKRLLQLPGVLRVFGNKDANFLLCQIADAREQKTPDSPRAERIYRSIADRGVVVRYRGNEYGCDGCLRITVGTPEETETLLKLLGEALTGPNAIH